MLLRRLVFSVPKFKKDYKTVDAVIRNFEIIGEAAKNLPDHIKENDPDLPWNEMYLQNLRPLPF